LAKSSFATGNNRNPLVSIETFKFRNKKRTKKEKETEKQQQELSNLGQPI
jgi:hypothetical protein